MSNDFLTAIDLAIGGDWDRAHRIVQQDESDPTAAWIHAALHRMEGDIGNARYWYRRAGRQECRDLEPIEELRSIRKVLAG